MSIWDIISGGALIDKTIDVAQKAFGIPDAAEKRKMQNDMNDQVKAYREQTELTKAELNKAKDAEAVEKRRIQEKQIRTLRNHYRPAGILGAAANNEANMSDKLGG